MRPSPGARGLLAYFGFFFTFGWMLSGQDDLAERLERDQPHEVTLPPAAKTRDAGPEESARGG